MKKILLVLVLLSVVSGAAAQLSFEDFVIVTEISNDDFIIMRATLDITAVESVDKITIPIFSEPGGLTSHDKKTFVEYNTYFSNGNIVIDKNLRSGEKISLDLRLIYTNLIKTDTKKTFLVDYALPNNTKHFEFIVKLPESYVLSDEAHPEPTAITSDGRRIIMDWNLQKPGESFVVTFDYTPAENQSNAMVVGLIVVTIILSAMVLFLLFKFLKTKKKVHKVMTVGLSGDEKKVYDLIRKSKEIKQKEIQQALDISKPRLSKLIRKLVAQELIETKPLGRTNIISAKKN